MDPITPVIERCKKRLEEVRGILNVWSTMYSSGEINGQRAKLQIEEKDLVTIIQALRFTRTLNFPAGPEDGKND